MRASEIHPLVLHGYGLVEASFDTTVARFGTHARADQSRMSVARTTTDVTVAIDHLSRLTVPETRLILVDLGSWTAVLTNARHGSDFNNHQYWAARTLAVTTIRVVDAQARWWRQGSQRERLGYEARIVEMRKPDGGLRRSITCADDGGRWVFETGGDPLPIEATFEYAAVRKKDRFTRENLRDLLVSVGPGPLTADGLLASPRFALLNDRIADDDWRLRVEAAATTYANVDNPAHGYFERGMRYVPHMRTHAASVIADLERALAIDPSYEPWVREHLREAYRVTRGR
jgi:hypothetical protein